MELNVFSEDEILYEKTVHEDLKGHIVKLCVNRFRGVEYLQLRKYYLDFDEEWKPSNEGVSMPLSFSNSAMLFEGLLEILSQAEAKDLIETHLYDLLVKLFQENS